MNSFVTAGLDEPGGKRDSPDEEPIDWSAECEQTAPCGHGHAAVRVLLGIESGASRAAAVDA